MATTLFVHLPRPLFRALLRPRTEVKQHDMGSSHNSPLAIRKAEVRWLVSKMDSSRRTPANYGKGQNTCLLVSASGTFHLGGCQFSLNNSLRFRTVKVGKVSFLLVSSLDQQGFFSDITMSSIGSHPRSYSISRQTDTKKLTARCRACTRLTKLHTRWSLWA